MTTFLSTADAIVAFKYRPLQIKSLFRRGRLATVWLIIAVLTIGFFVPHIYRRSVERHLHDLLRAELYHLIDTVNFADEGILAGNPQLGDMRFSQSKTGWYWMVEPVGDPTGKPLVSMSLGPSSLPEVSKSETPFDQNYQRSYGGTDAFGNQVEVVEMEVVLAPDGRAARFRVAGNVDGVDKDVREFSLILYLILGGLGVGGLIISRLSRRIR